MAFDATKPRTAASVAFQELLPIDEELPSYKAVDIAPTNIIVGNDCCILQNPVAVLLA